MKFTDKTRRLIQERANDRCEICGARALNHQIHHRRPRGMGGSKDKASGTPANGIWVHPSCHARIESNREEALSNGWLVRQGKNPAETPFRRYDRWVILNEDGSMSSPQTS